MSKEVAILQAKLHKLESLHKEQCEKLEHSTLTSGEYLEALEQANDTLTKIIKTSNAITRIICL